MREKVEKLLQGKEVIVKTFHSFCAELIKDHAERCKVPGDFKIFEEMDSAIFIFRELETYGDLNKIALWYLDVYGTQELNDTFRYIIIDEFQDTNYVQFELIKKLTAANKNLTVVADPNQTIYAFRGAYTNNIEEFKKQFSLPDKDTVSLDVSFRSTNKILRVANTLIEKNYGAEKRQECLLLKNHTDTEGENVSIIETEVSHSASKMIPIF